MKKKNLSDFSTREIVEALIRKGQGFYGPDGSMYLFKDGKVLLVVFKDGTNE